MKTPKRAPFPLIALALALALSACGLGRDAGGDGGAIHDPIVAATVNGRPIYIEDVRAHAVARGWLRETEDLDANSDAVLHRARRAIQVRLFMEAKRAHRRADIRRQAETHASACSPTRSMTRSMRARPIQKPSSACIGKMPAGWARAKKSICVRFSSRHVKSPRGQKKA
ncbi:MAG: hypothetical protein R3C25_08105 [Hyphomonadaceae bacterium]